MNRFGLVLCPKKSIEKNLHFPPCKFAHFPLFYKITVRGLKIEAIFFILVHMIAVYHCAKEQLA